MNHDHITLLIKRVMLAGTVALIMPIFIYQVALLSLTKSTTVAQIIYKPTQSPDKKTVIRKWHSTQEYTISKLLLIACIVFIVAGIFITASGLSLCFIFISLFVNSVYLISILFGTMLIFMVSLTWHELTSHYKKDPSQKQ